MRSMLTALLLSVSSACFAYETTVSNNVPPSAKYEGEVLSQAKLAKEYYMTSADPAAGGTYEQRTANLSKKVKELLTNYSTTRATQYGATRFEFGGSDWATGKHTPKTENIPAHTYVFMSIERTRNGDWKGGPTINGVSRSGWTSGDIPGGPVHWVTGGHGKAQTYWKISARYSDEYIKGKAEAEVAALRKKLNDANIPTEI